MSQLERIYYFHHEVAAGRYPNASMIMGRFQVSLATAHRDITYMRDRLDAPLDYDAVRQGYFYGKEGFRLPFEDSQALMFFFAMLHKLADDSGLGGIKEVKRLKACLGKLLFSDHRRLAEWIHCEHIEVETVDTSVLRTIIEAYRQSRPVDMVYRKLDGNADTRRTVVPLRLIHYQGRWYVLGWCHLRRALRIFHVSRIQEAAVSEHPCPEDLPECLPDLNDFLEGAFGIFKGEAVERARILFVGTAAAIVRHQLWHRDQSIEETEEGIILDLPVGNFTELKMKVLQFGAGARVLEPAALRDIWRDEIRRMAAVVAASESL